MAEADTVDRVEIYREESRGFVKVLNRGQLIAGALAVLAMIASFVLFWRGNELGGSVFLAVPLLGLIGKFITGATVPIDPQADAERGEASE